MDLTLNAPFGQEILKKYFYVNVFQLGLNLLPFELLRLFP